MRLLITSWLFVITLNCQAANIAYISNQGDQSIQVIDLDTRQTVSSIALDHAPLFMAADTIRNIVYVTHPESGLISIIDTKQHQLIDEIDTGGQPYDVLTDPANNGAVFITDSEREAVLVVNPETRMVVDLLNVGREPTGLAINTEAGHLYVANTKGDTVTVLDTIRPRKHAEFVTDAGPYALYFSKHRQRLYVACVDGNSLMAFNTRELEPESRIEVAAAPYDVIEQDDGDVLVASQRGNRVSRYSPDLELKSKIKTGRMPEKLLVSTGNRQLLVLNWFSETVDLIDQDGNNQRISLPVGRSPRDILLLTAP